MNTHPHDIQKEVRGYLVVFAALAGLTIITVTIKYLHLGLTAAITVALIIATIKGSLVVCYFMHLISEKTVIYSILIFSAIFISGLVILLLGGYYDVQTGIKFLHY